jgi:four helix bundle protein
MNAQEKTSERKAFLTFEDLEVYKAAREFRKCMYGCAGRLPESEKYGLASQVRRAAVSLTNNIAEGHGWWPWLDHIKFVLQSRGSLAELMDDLNVCGDERYLPEAEVGRLKQQGWSVLRLVNGYLGHLRRQKSGESLGLREDSSHYGELDDELESWRASLPI